MSRCLLTRAVVSSFKTIVLSYWIKMSVSLELKCHLRSMKIVVLIKVWMPKQVHLLSLRDQYLNVIVDIELRPSVLRRPDLLPLSYILIVLFEVSQPLYSEKFYTPSFPTRYISRTVTRKPFHDRRA
jgi:hypothetical protein